MSSFFSSVARVFCALKYAIGTTGFTVILRVTGRICAIFNELFALAKAKLKDPWQISEPRFTCGQERASLTLGTPAVESEADTDCVQEFGIPAPGTLILSFTHLASLRAESAS